MKQASSQGWDTSRKYLMSHQPTAPESGAVKWFKINFDAFFELWEGSRISLRQLLKPMLAWVKRPRHKPRKAKYGYLLRVDELEARQMPSTYTWVGGGGDNHWSTAANWSSSTVPGAGDSAILSTSDTVLLDANIVIASFTLSAGNLDTGSHSINVTATGSTWSGGTISGSGNINLQSGSTLTISAAVTLDHATIINGGVITLSSGGDFTLTDSATLSNDNEFDWTGTGDLHIEDNSTVSNGAGMASFSSFSYDGLFDIKTDADILSTDGTGLFINNYNSTVEKTVATGTSSIDVDFHNPGTVDDESGTLD